MSKPVLIWICIMICVYAINATSGNETALHRERRIALLEGLDLINKITLKNYNIGQFIKISDEEVEKIISYLTIGCYTDPELVPGAMKKCVGTSVNLIRGLIQLLDSVLIQVDTSAPSEEMQQQSICFLTGLGVLDENGEYNDQGFQRIADSIEYSSNLRNYVAEGVEICRNSDNDSQYLALCIERALLMIQPIPNGTLKVDYY